MLLPLVVLTAYALIAFGPASAALTNITVDDTNSTYWTFVGSYHAVTPSTPCINCGDNPDPGLVYNNSWHDGALRSGSFVFQGSAVYIYGIDVTNPANVTFAMTGNNPVNSFHFYSGDGYVYNSLFFSATNLDVSIQHTVTWLMETSTFGGQSALFDYAVVTVNQADSSSSSASAGTSGSASASSPSSTPSPTSSASPSPTVSPKKKSNTGAIAGGTVGAAVVLLAIVAALFFFLRRRGPTTGGDIDGAHNFYGSDVASRGTSGGTAGYTVEPFQPLPPPRPGVHSEDSDSRSMSAVPTSVVRSAPVPSTPRGTGGATGYTVEPYPPLVPLRRPVVHSEDSDSRSMSTTSMSAASMAPVRSAPVPTRSSSSKVPPAPVVLAWDPSDQNGQRARDLEVQERLRHLEELVAASQPPVYS